MTDLMTHLIELYQNSGEEKEKLVTVLADPDLGEIGTSKVVVEHFQAFARSYLLGNPIIGLVPLQVGLGIRLRDGTEVFIMPQAAQAGEPQQPPTPESLPITRPKSAPGQHGISDTKSIPVFGGGK